MPVLNQRVSNAKALLCSLALAYLAMAHAENVVAYDYSDADYAADQVEADDYSDADYAADQVEAEDYSESDYAADQYDEAKYADEHYVAASEDESTHNLEDDIEEEDEDDDEDESIAGDFESLIIPEVTLEYDKSTDITSPGELSANVYGYYQMMLSDDLEFLLEAEINTQSTNGRDHLALQKPELTIGTIGFNYYTDFGGVGIGKFDLLREEGLFDAIWARQLYGRENLPASDLDLSDVIGARVWFDLEDILPGSHTLYLGAFFRDNTFLNDAYLSRSSNADDRISGLGYTRRLNNWMLSLMGSDLESLPGWEYVVGASLLNNSNPDLLFFDEDEDSTLEIVSREVSLFSGFYGDFELSNGVEVNPLFEFLYRDGADGFDQNVVSLASGISFNQGNWAYGGYYSFRRTHEITDDVFFNDQQIQAFLTYTFDSGIYLDIEHQRNLFDDEKSNATYVSLGIPITISKDGNLYGNRKAKDSDQPLNNVRRFIRRR